jgi:signal transduction histidine kinase
MTNTRKSALWRSFKGNLVIVFVLAALLFIDILVLYLLNEKASKEKGEIIRFTQIDQLDQAARWTNELHNRIEMNAAGEQLIRTTAEFLSEDNMFFRVEFYPFVDIEEKRYSEEPAFVFEQPGKKALLNDWNNSVFSLSFEEFRVFRKRLGLFHVYNASPRNVAEIELLVQRYRIQGGLFVLFSLALVYLMLRQIVMPLRRVSRMLEIMSDEYIPLLDNPRANIEVSYNSMAKNARLTQLGVLLSELVSDTQKEMMRGEDPVVEASKKIPRILCDYMNFHRIALFNRDDTSGNWEWGYGFDIDRGEMVLGSSFAEGVDLALLSRQRIPLSASPEQIGMEPPAENRIRQCAIVPVHHNNKPLCYAVLWPSAKYTSEADLLDTAESVRGEIEEIFLKIISRTALLDEEKNEVSIHLSTNLGHDLTNIIATGKWDLETLKKGVDMGIVRVEGRPIQQQRFQEAVQGLVNNSRMLQEVVNIYRAFGYAHRPTYERVDAHELVEQLAEVFQLSTSKNVSVEVDLQAADSEWVLEPRMIKLVLFNLMSNSVQAISKVQELGQDSSGKIRIETENTAEGWLSIAVMDAGTGFRNENGEPMTPRELRRIFRYGFTTKRDEARGGLGLSWVWTIVTEFHEGQIVPSNRPEGGAMMRILIPPLPHKLPRQQDDTLAREMPMM